MPLTKESKEQTLLQATATLGTFNKFVSAVRAAGLDSTLNSAGPFTVFAPTDEAFARLPAGTLESLLSDKKNLARLLKNHIVPGKFYATGEEKRSYRTMAGTKLALDPVGGRKVNEIEIVRPDIECRNGVVHAIDDILTVD